MAANTTTFATRLREATSRHHARAEHGTVVTDLVAGRLPLQAYAALASQHWFLYEALERVAEDHLDDVLAGPFVDPRLHRLSHLQADLAHLLGPDWGERIRPLPATERYVRRIETVAARSAPAFVAHHYTRYLGDLSGGQAIAASLRRTYGLPGFTGTAFYVFADLRTPRDAKTAYRDLLDTTPFTPAQQQELIDECGVAYLCNTAVFADLATSMHDAVVAPAVEAPARAEGPGA